MTQIDLSCLKDSSIPLLYSLAIISLRIPWDLLAKTGRADFADLHRLTPDSEKIAELQMLTRDQDALIHMQTRLVNQLTACLKA